MGRSPCCSKVGLHRGPWTAREDALLTKYIQHHGEGQWRSLPKNAGLLRCGKSCRLRWMNYLRPDIRRGNIMPDEDDLIIRMHALLGNRWSLIAGRLPGRTDNEIKNYWNTRLSRNLRSQGIDPNTHKRLPQSDPPLIQTTKRKRSNRISSNALSTNKQTNNEEVERIKVHYPKPLRFPSSISYYMKTNYSNAIIRNEDNGEIDSEILGVDDDQWSNHVGVNNILIQEIDDLGCDDVAQAFNYSSLDKLYEEYLQLLKSEENENISLC